MGVVLFQVRVQWTVLHNPSFPFPFPVQLPVPYSVNMPLYLVERLLHYNAPNIVFTLEWPRFHVSNLHVILHTTFVSNKLYPQLNFTTVSIPSTCREHLELAVLIQSTDTINSFKFNAWPLTLNMLSCEDLTSTVNTKNFPECCLLSG